MKRATALLSLASFYLVFVVMLSLSGCTSYYKVHDPTTGKDYYTTELKQKKHGAATLKDGRTGSSVTIQNSEISKITKEEYETGRYAPQ